MEKTSNGTIFTKTLDFLFEYGRGYTATEAAATQQVTSMLTGSIFSAFS